jgi:hypothetical protein
MAFAPLVGAAALGSGCGSMPSRDSAGGQWRANLSVLLHQLHADLGLAQVGGGTPSTARSALLDDSSLFALLVAYTDFGGCRRMVAQAGGGFTVRERRVEAEFDHACDHFVRAANLFARAAGADDGGVLLAALHEANRGMPALIRAGAALDRPK